MAVEDFHRITIEGLCDVGHADNFLDAGFFHRFDGEVFLRIVGHQVRQQFQLNAVMVCPGHATEAGTFHDQYAYRR